MRCDSWASLLACNLANPCLGREPKAKVATTKVNVIVKGHCSLVHHQKFVEGI